MPTSQSQRLERAERNDPAPTNRLFPKTHRELFNTILDEEGLKKIPIRHRFST